MTDLAAENARLRSDLARAYETIDAMLNISRCIATRVPFEQASDTPRYPEIGTGRIPANPVAPTPDSSPAPARVAVGVGERAYQEVMA